MRKKKEAAAAAPIAAPSIPAPGVYRNRGFMVLVTDCEEGRVSYIKVSDDAGKYVRGEYLEIFSPRYKHAKELLPAALALNLLARAVEGAFQTSAQAFRRILEMATNKSELLAMPIDGFAREYARLMKSALPAQLSDKDREAAADRMIVKLNEEKAAMEKAATQAPEDESPEAPADSDAAASATAKNESASQKGIGIMAKAKKGGKTGAAKVKQVREAMVIDASLKTVNPYRESSKKHKAFEIYKAGGERPAILKKIVALGCTESTAKSWAYFFKGVIETGKQPDWDKAREKKAPKAAAPKKEAAKKPAAKKAAKKAKK